MISLRPRLRISFFRGFMPSFVVCTGIVITALCLSLFFGKPQASKIRFAVLVLVWPFFTAVALLRGIQVYSALKTAPPQIAAVSTMKDAIVQIGSTTGWPLRPIFSYGKYGRYKAAEIIGTCVAAATLATFSILTGVTNLLADMAPSFLPKGLTDRLLRSAVHGHVKDGLFFLGFGILICAGAGAAIWVGWRRFLRTMRPLAINGRGVYAFYRGRPWRFLAWSDVKAICKLRIPADTLTGYRHEIRIEGTNLTILIRPQISGFAEACRLISTYSREHAIKLLFIDKGRDTIKAQRGMVAPEKYRQIARKGLITEVAEL